MVATANPMPMAPHRNRPRSGGVGLSDATVVPRTPARHSDPRTRPRAGTAHARQRGRPQPSQLATEGLPG